MRKVSQPILPSFPISTQFLLKSENECFQVIIYGLIEKKISFGP